MLPLAAWIFAATPCFAAPVRYASAADQAVLVRDLDGDGAPEIVASGNQVDEVSAFSLFSNHGDGSFAAERTIESEFGEKIEDARDLDGDGVVDLLGSRYWSNGIAVHRGRGALRFDTGVPLGTATHGGPSRIVDYDGDGVPDIVSLSFGSGNPVRVHLFRGPALTPKTTIETSLANGVTPSSRTIGGAFEILVAEHSGHLGLLRFTGGSIALSRIEVGPGFDLSSAFADIDGDGVADIVDTNDSGAVFVTLGKSDGTFGERRQIGAVPFPVGIQTGDLDGDGRTDIVVSDFRTPSVYLFLGSGAEVVIDAGGPVNDFKVADVNGDGRPDLITANDDHTISVVINGGPCARRRRAVGR
jgi:hypothetical protein